MSQLEPPDPYPISWSERLWIAVTIPLLNAALRIADICVLLIRPRLLRAYASIWIAQWVRSPFKWPAGFETVRALKDTEQTVGELVYGETPVITSLRILSRAGVTRGSHFIDLGAGRGRVLIAARWLGAAVIGVELLHAHVTAVAPALLRTGIRLVEGDAMRFPLNGATHVFCSWLGLKEPTRAKLLDRFRTCDPGTRFITIGDSIGASDFAVIAEGRLPFTWGGADYYIHERSPPRSRWA